MTEELEPLIMAADLSVYGVDDTDDALVDQLIAVVSSGIREAAGAPISKVTSTVDLYGKPSEFLALPGGPLREVVEVTDNGKAVTDYKIRDGRLWRKAGWGDIEDDIVVRYTHGWDPVPADVKKLAVNLVAAGINEATSDGGLASRRGLVSSQESIDDYSRQESYVRGEDEVVDLTEVPDRTRTWLRQRFGQQSYVTGSY